MVTAVHPLYEELKTDVFTQCQLPALARFLWNCAAAAGYPAHQDYYFRDFPQQCGTTSTEGPRTAACPDESTPLSIYGLLSGILEGPSPPAGCPPEALGRLLPRSAKLVRYYEILLRSPCPLELLQAMIDDGWTPALLESLPLGLAFGLRSRLMACQEMQLPLSLPVEAYLLADRPDLVALRAGPADEGNIRQADEIFDAEQAAVVSGLRFSSDQRLKEVHQLLRSDIPIALREKASSNTGKTEHEIHLAHQMRLSNLILRQMALSVGRGMLTLSSKRMTLGKSLVVPLLDLTGLVRSTKQVLTIDDVMLLPEAHVWAAFHNGVAAGLSLSSALPAGALNPDSGSSYGHPPSSAPSSAGILSSFFEMPEQANDGYAGVLMALGLQGHLRAMPLSLVYDHLLASHPKTSIGLLLGLGASYAGTMDVAINKLLTIHVPALHPPASTSLERAPSIQTAALLAFGLLFRETAHRRMTDILIGDICRPPTEDRNFCRESHSLAAGLALGMITLGKGSSVPALFDLNLEKRLIALMNGRVYDPKADSAETRGPHLPKAPHTTPPEKCPLVLEPDDGSGSYANVDITAPAALMALLLMFLKTNDRSIAAQLEIPTTCFLLDQIRPTILMLRVLTRQLILWDSVEPTAAWVFDQRSRDYSLAHSWAERATLTVSAINVITGLTLALGLRYAGTADEQASQLIESIFDVFFSIRKGMRGNAKLNVRGLHSHLLHSSLCISALAWSMVLAGTGDERALVKIRFVSKLYMGDPGFSYGNHMGVHMALGFLFLGGGRRTLCRSNAAIAGLLCSVYPVFPATITGNRYHMQALRHMYVLAIENRCFVVRDLASLQPSRCPILLTLVARSSQQRLQPPPSLTRLLVSPCLLPPFEEISQIEIQSSEFCPLVISGPIRSTICLAKARSTARLLSPAAAVEGDKDDDGALARYFTLAPHSAQGLEPSEPAQARDISAHLRDFSAFSQCVFSSAPTPALPTYYFVFQVLDALEQGAFSDSLRLQQLQLLAHAANHGPRISGLSEGVNLCSLLRLKLQQFIGSTLVRGLLPGPVSALHSRYLLDPVATLEPLSEAQRAVFAAYLIVTKSPSPGPRSSEFAIWSEEI